MNQIKTTPTAPTIATLIIMKHTALRHCNWVASSWAKVLFAGCNSFARPTPPFIVECLRLAQNAVIEQFKSDGGKRAKWEWKVLTTGRSSPWRRKHCAHIWNGQVKPEVRELAMCVCHQAPLNTHFESILVSNDPYAICDWVAIVVQVCPCHANGTK